MKIIFLFLSLVSFSTQIYSNSLLSAGYLSGKIYDAASEKPLAFADIYIHGIKRHTASWKDGSFFLKNLPNGRYALHVSHVGYVESDFNITISPEDTTEIIIKLDPHTLSGEVIVIKGDKDKSVLDRPDLEMSGQKLRHNLGQTLAETLSDEPGLDMQTNGPAPARPVLRGLGGDRLLLLENGERTGDLSTTAADHAVTIEPITVERVEVIRGPKALEYGANALAGVINVIRHRPQCETCEGIGGQISLHGESVNTGLTGAGLLEFPLLGLPAAVDFSYRNANNTSSPSSKIKNTYIRTLNGSANFLHPKKWGAIRFGYSLYQSDYGIPPAPDSLGSHPFGIDIELEKHKFESSLEIIEPFNFSNSLEIDYDYTNYYHEEFSTVGLDAAFSVQTHHLTLRAKLKDSWLFKNGQLGYWAEYRQYESGGRTNTVDTDQLTQALYLYSEQNLNKLNLNAAFRIEHKNVIPRDEELDLRVGYIRQRQFLDFASSFRTRYFFTTSFDIGFTFFRAFRAPGIEELFSDGPHLAAYAYEVGNANLDSEKTLGFELTSNLNNDLFNLTAATFYNRIDNYLFAQNTGQRSWRRYDLYRYQIVGLDSEIKGAELTAGFQLMPYLKLETSLSYIHGTLKETYVYKDPKGQIPDSEFEPFIKDADEPLPFMPPLKGSMGISYKYNPFSAALTAQFAGRQDRPGQFEKSTPKYTKFNLSLEYYFPSGSSLHILSLNADNLTNETYRSHLNRIKEIFPEPGRNIKLLYKILF